MDLGEARYANRGRFKTGGFGVGHIFPGEFQILGSNDGAAWDDATTSDKWIVVGSVAGYTQPSSSYTWAAEFTLDNPGYYRITESGLQEARLSERLSTPTAR